MCETHSTTTQRLKQPSCNPVTCRIFNSSANCRLRNSLGIGDYKYGHCNKSRRRSIATKYLPTTIEECFTLNATIFIWCNIPTSYIAMTFWALSAIVPWATLKWSSKFNTIVFSCFDRSKMTLKESRRAHHYRSLSSKRHYRHHTSTLTST